MDYPRYLQILYLLSVHVFIMAKVDCAIYETHMGGKYDATNAVRKPVITAVTSVSEDHLRWLGPDLADVAWHKGGIFKPDSLAFTPMQAREVMKVLVDRASSAKATLQIVEVDKDIETEVGRPLSYAQKMNYSLAKVICTELLNIHAPQTELVSTTIGPGLMRVPCPGRFQFLSQGVIDWYIDGAHNVDSMEQATTWFIDRTCDQERHERRELYPVKLLIFAHFSARDSPKLLQFVEGTLMERGIEIQSVILTSYDERSDGDIRVGKFPFVALMLQGAHHSS